VIGLFEFRIASGTLVGTRDVSISLTSMSCLSAAFSVG